MCSYGILTLWSAPVQRLAWPGTWLSQAKTSLPLLSTKTTLCHLSAKLPLRTFAQRYPMFPEFQSSTTIVVTSWTIKHILSPIIAFKLSKNLLQVMASSWAPDLQEQIQQTRILGFVNSSVNLMRSHIPFVSNAGSDSDHTSMVNPKHHVLWSKSLY